MAEKSGQGCKNGPGASLRFSRVVVYFFLQVLSPARVATWRAFEVPWDIVVAKTIIIDTWESAYSADSFADISLSWAKTPSVRLISNHPDRLFLQTHGFSNGCAFSARTGPFFTVISDGEYESFAEWQAEGQEIFGDARFATWFERMTALVESGRREFDNLVE